VPQLQQIGKQLKKNNVAVDVVCMGELEENTEKLTEFIKAVNSNDNSHLVSVPSGVSPLDAIGNSPLVAGNTHYGGGNLGGAGGGGFEEFGGIDPNMDPELAMAIRVSTEEARAHEEARAQEALRQSGGAPSSSSSSSAAAQGTGFGGAAAVDEDDEEAMLRNALSLSMMDIGNSDGSGGVSGTDADDSAAAIRAAAVGDEDEDVRTRCEHVDVSCRNP
jgi:26S proteasome regulatory subunit N10